MDTTASNTFGPWLDTVTLTANTPDPGMIPLPAGMWLLLSALGAGLVVQARLRQRCGSWRPRSGIADGGT